MIIKVSDMDATITRHDGNMNLQNLTDYPNGIPGTFNSYSNWKTVWVGSFVDM
jgi:hypothetical protein